MNSVTTTCPDICTSSRMSSWPSSNIFTKNLMKKAFVLQLGEILNWKENSQNNVNRKNFLYKIFQPIGVPSRSCPNLILHLCTKMTNEHRLSKLKKGTKILFRIRLKKSSYILNRPRNFAKSPPISWLAVHRTNKTLQFFVAFIEYMNFIFTKFCMLARIMAKFRRNVGTIRIEFM